MTMTNYLKQESENEIVYQYILEKSPIQLSAQTCNTLKQALNIKQISKRAEALAKAYANDPRGIEFIQRFDIPYELQLNDGYTYKKGVFFSPKSQTYQPKEIQ